MKTLKPKTRDAILQLARWQVGVCEMPAGSNKVKYNSWYYGREVSGAAYPWCMVFVQWIFHQAGFNLTRTASCSYLAGKYKAAGQWVTEGFKPGDIVMFDFSGKKSKTEHCGIVLEVHKDYIITSEGNTGVGNDANGGAVMERKRELRFVTGACRPNYNM